MSDSFLELNGAKLYFLFYFIDKLIKQTKTDNDNLPLSNFFRFFFIKTMKLPKNWISKFLEKQQPHLWRRNDDSQFIDFYLSSNIRVGKIHQDNAKFIKNYFPHKICLTTTGVKLAEKYDFDIDSRSKLLEEIAFFAKDKLIPFDTFRNELYPIYGLDFHLNEDNQKMPLAYVERGASPFFGIQAWGTHCTIYRKKDNGDEDDNDNIEILVPIRAAHKKWPNMYDSSVAGGLAFPSNEIISPRYNMIKECLEETGLDLNKIDNKYQLNYLGQTSHLKINSDRRQYKPRTQINYEVQVDKNFKPDAVDGEVASFQWFSPEKIISMDILVNGSFKPNSAVVLVQFLMAKKLVHCDDWQKFIHKSNSKLLVE